MSLKLHLVLASMSKCSKSLIKSYLLMHGCCFFLQNNRTGFTEGAPYSKGESGTPGGPEAAVREETKSNKGKVNF